MADKGINLSKTNYEQPLDLSIKRKDLDTATKYNVQTGAHTPVDNSNDKPLDLRVKRKRLIQVSYISIYFSISMFKLVTCILLYIITNHVLFLIYISTYKKNNKNTLS